MATVLAPPKTVADLKARSIPTGAPDAAILAF